MSRFDLREGDWPGMSYVTRQAERRCLSAVASAATDAPRRAEIEAFYFHPTEQSWQQDDRTVLCIAIFPQPRSGAL